MEVKETEEKTFRFCNSLNFSFCLASALLIIEQDEISQGSSLSLLISGTVLSTDSEPGIYDRCRVHEYDSSALNL